MEQIILKLPPLSINIFIHMFYYIYKITNINTQKKYIGSHQTNNLEDGYFGSGIYLKRAIAKHGKDSFKKEILEFCSSKEEMHNRETEVLRQLQEEDLYNLKYAAFGGNTRASYTPEEKAAYIKKLIDNPNSPIGKKGNKAFNFGKELSPELKQRMKESRQHYLNTASEGEIKRWKANVVNKAKPRCKLMAEINSMPVIITCKSTNKSINFDTKTDCAIYLGVSIQALTRYISNNFKRITPHIRTLLLYNIRYINKAMQ